MHQLFDMHRRQTKWVLNSSLWDEASSNASINSKLLPLQQKRRGLVDTALNNCELNKTLFFTAGTCQPQWAIDMVINFFHSQKPILKPRRLLVLKNFNEYIFSRCKMVAICFNRQTKQWWRRAWNKHIWLKQGHNIRLIPNQNKNDEQTIIPEPTNWPKDKLPQFR